MMWLKTIITNQARKMTRIKLVVTEYIQKQRNRWKHPWQPISLKYTI